jgi:hypothetical protein
MKQILFAVLLIAVVTGVASAQMSNSLFGLSWNVGIPFGKTKDFIDKTSYSGVSFEGRTWLNREVAVGGMFGWSVFDLVSRDPIEIDRPEFGGTITGTQDRWINAFPIMVSGYYHFGRGDIVPYAGTNLGVYHIIQRFGIGTVAFESRNWHFGIAPEAGIMIGLSRTTYLMVSARYNYAFASGTNVAGESGNSYTWLSLNLGLGFTSF